MKVAFSPTFVLHQRPFRETSIIMDVLSRDHGRISVIAKGSKQGKKSQSALLQPYQPLLMSWLGRSELQTLTAVEADGPAYLLQSKAALCGLYVNELMVKLLPQGEAEPELFAAYQQVLYRLQESNDHEVILRLFEKKLLSHLGYGLVIDREVETGETIQSEQTYYYIADRGLYRWSSESKYPKVSGRSLIHLIKEEGFDRQSLTEIKQLMRMVIHFYLAGRPLHSRALFSPLQSRTKEGKS